MEGELATPKDRISRMKTYIFTELHVPLNVEHFQNCTRQGGGQQDANFMAPPSAYSSWWDSPEHTAQGDGCTYPWRCEDLPAGVSNSIWKDHPQGPASSPTTATFRRTNTACSAASTPTMASILPGSGPRPRAASGSGIPPSLALGSTMRLPGSH